MNDNELLAVCELLLRHIDTVTDGYPGPHSRAPEAQQAEWKRQMRIDADAARTVITNARNTRKQEAA